MHDPIDDPRARIDGGFGAHEAPFPIARLATDDGRHLCDRARPLRRADEPDADPEMAAHSQESVLESQRRLAREGRARVILPDLVIVDGGKGQLSVAVAELRQLGLHELPIIGLAKQREEVFFPDVSEPLLISHDRGALKLLQRIRDEAHRFANGYNALLLRRRMRESLLDECPFITPARKKSLLRHFGSVVNLRKASLEMLSACPGLPATVAAHLHAWLHPPAKL